MTTTYKLTAEDYVGSHRQTTPAADQSPLLILLPGLQDSDSDFDSIWDPIRDKLPVFRVSYLDWTDLVQPGAGFSDLIFHIKRQIEHRLPTGPLRIAGYSIGGCLAYAVALALQSEGRHDLRLAIFDAPANIEPLDRSPGRKLRDLVRSLLQFRVGKVLASVIARVLTKEPARPLLRSLCRFRQTRLPFNFGKYLHPVLTMQLEMQLFRPWWRTLARPASQLTGPTFVFRSKYYDLVAGEDLGWGKCCSDCTVIRVAGDHNSMLQPEHNGPLLATLVSIMTASRN